MYISLAMCLAAMMPFTCIAQVGQYEIKGIVVDEEDVPLVGANIKVVGGKQYAVSNVDGKFSIVVAGKETELAVSYIGMRPTSVKVNSQDPNITIRMKYDSRQIDEVVVTGYQNIKRESATGAYHVISSNDFEQRYTSSIASNLEGKVPGLINYNNGLKSGLSIRGVSTFNASTSPLVVVDGLPIDESIESINPYNIESITVLKDAAAASIYGARASNGVIVVVTKQAKSEKINVSFSSDLTISNKQTYDNYGWANAEEQIALEEYNYDATINSPYAESLIKNATLYPSTVSPIVRMLLKRTNGTITNEEYEAYRNKLSKNNYLKEWSDAVLLNQVLQQYNLSIRIKNKHLASTITGNYKRSNRGIKKENSSELMFSYRGDYTMNKWLDLSFGITTRSTRGKSHSDTFGLVLSPTAYAPYWSIYNDDGSKAYYQGKVYLGEESLADKSNGFKSEEFNLLNELNYNFTTTRNSYIRSFAHATVKILPQLKVSGQFQYEDRNNKSSTHLEPESYAMRHIYNLYTVGGVHYCPEGGILSSTNSTADNYTARFQADYNQTFGKKHEVTAILGFEARESKNRSVSDRMLGYVDRTLTNSMTSVKMDEIRKLQSGKTKSDLGENYPTNAFSLASGWSVGETKHRYTSFYFTGNYVYDHRYSASVSYRVDKTDLFGADPKYRGRPLWSIGGSWNINNESFMSKISWVDMLKLRISYGMTGNINSSVSSFLTGRIYKHTYIYDTQAAGINTPPNEQLRWEKTATWNGGIDFAVLDYRINGSLDFYYKQSSDLLSATELDPTTGWETLTINNGEAVNKGVELQLNFNIVKPKRRTDFGANVSWGFAYNYNKITKISYYPNMGINVLGWGQSYHTLMDGKPINSLYAWKFAGYQNDDSGNKQMTWYQADGTITNNGIYTALQVDDCVYVGGLDPKYSSSLVPEISYKGFSLSAMFAYYGGHYMRANASEWKGSGSYLGYGSGGGVLASNLNYWHDPDSPTTVPNGVAAESLRMEAQAIPYMDQCAMPADYLKLRNIILSYSIPTPLCRRFNINSAKIRVQMNNVATWVKNKYGIDPEANNAWTGYNKNKAPKSYTMSLNVNF